MSNITPYIIAIISFILVYWFQYPYIKYNDKISLYHNIYNIYKLPLIITCIILLSYNIYDVCNNKPKELDLNLDIFQY